MIYLTKGNYLETMLEALWMDCLEEGCSSEETAEVIDAFLKPQGLTLHKLLNMRQEQYEEWEASQLFD